MLKYKQVRLGPLLTSDRIDNFMKSGILWSSIKHSKTYHRSLHLINQIKQPELGHEGSLQFNDKLAGTDLMK